MTEDAREFDPHNPRTKAQKECVDFLGVFGPKIMPTSIRILERNGHLLFIRHYGFGEEITPAHDRIWRLLTRYGHVDSPGTISVVCLWGIAATRSTVGTERRIRVYDFDGAHDVEVATDGSIKAALDKWWRDFDYGR